MTTTAPDAGRSVIGRLVRARELALIILILALVTATTINQPGFVFSDGGWRELLRQPTIMILIALGEATSNVVRHAYVDGNRGGMRVRITVADSSVDVAVSDQGTWRAPSPDGGGMGLGIIESIADDVDLSTTPDGTTLRFRIALGGSAEGTPISTS